LGFFVFSKAAGTLIAYVLLSKANAMLAFLSPFSGNIPTPGFVSEPIKVGGWFEWECVHIDVTSCSDTATYHGYPSSQCYKLPSFRFLSSTHKPQYVQPILLIKVQVILPKVR
jgi:hypothetical protein